MGTLFVPSSFLTAFWLLLINHFQLRQSTSLTSSYSLPSWTTTTTITRINEHDHDNVVNEDGVVVAQPVTSLTDAFAGVASGSLAKTISAPIERMNLLKQLQHSVDPKDASGLRGSVWSVAKTVYKK
jgi:hypothetical protein